MSTLLIAPGHDNQANAKAFWELSPPLFEEYAAPESVFTLWSSYEDRIMDGERNWIPIGLPSIRLTFFDLKRDEYAYLLTLAGEVTVYALNKDANAYQWFNAKLAEPRTSEQQWDRELGDGFDDVTTEIYDMEAIE